MTSKSALMDFCRYSCSSLSSRQTSPTYPLPFIMIDMHIISITRDHTETSHDLSILYITIFSSLLAVNETMQSTVHLNQVQIQGVIATLKP